MTEIMAIDDWFIQQSQMMNRLDKLAGEYGVSFLQYEILVYIDNCECASPTNIATRMQVSKSSVSRSLKVLHRKNLIERVHGIDDDQRRIEVAITSEARKIINKISDDLEKVEL